MRKHLGYSNYNIVLQNTHDIFLYANTMLRNITNESTTVINIYEIAQLFRFLLKFKRSG